MEIIVQEYEYIIAHNKIEVEEFESLVIQTGVDDLLGDLNPRFFEEASTPENALEKLYSSNIRNCYNSTIRVF
jgi:hypothetical protein